MKTYKKKSIGKEALARVLLAVFLVHQIVGTSLAAPLAIPTASINLTVLASVQPSLTNLALMQWRQAGAAGQSPVPATSLSFAYFNSGTNLQPPNRTTVKDWTANDQNDLWSDDVLQVSFIKGNTLSSAIVIYTANHTTLTSATGLTEAANNDPLTSASLRGGLVGCTDGAAVPTTAVPAPGAAANPTCTGDTNPPTDPGRQVILPLLWKSVTLSALQAASSAKVDGSVPLALNTPLDMATEVVAATGGNCPLEFLYPASTRLNNGFCDYSTHYFLDLFNTDPNNLFYSNYSKTTATVKRQATFSYQSLVGAFGVNTNETGTGGGGSQSPAYFVLGISAANAIPAQFGTTIYVDSLTE